ncbi:MAG: diphthine--ammonia ligase, partial [archaeon]|nr:diphthine--ammonia ligase [archaeon]
YMFHTPNIDITKLQAEAIGIPMVRAVTEGVKEEELEDLKCAIKQAKEKYRIEGIVTGAIESVYQSRRIQKICDDLNLVCINPLWKKDQKKLLEELVNSGYDIMISGIFAYPMDERWLGKHLDKKMITELVRLNEKYQISPVGEGGEIETTVLDAPFFKKKIKVNSYEIKAEKNSGILIINDAELAEK